MNLLDQSLGQIACEIAGATRVFHQHKLDFCCGGQKTLREAAARRKLDGEAIAAQLASLNRAEGAYTDWRKASNSEIIAYILPNFHDRHRQQFPELIRMARRVELVHGDNPNCPTGLADALEAMQHDLESHMQKEEQVLFPMLNQRSAAEVSDPIMVMRYEHDQHGESLEHLEGLAHDFVPPQGACNTWRALYLGLDQLRQDLMQHIHLENNILFTERTSATVAA